MPSKLFMKAKRTSFMKLFFFSIIHIFFENLATSMKKYFFQCSVYQHTGDRSTLPIHTGDRSTLHIHTRDRSRLHIDTGDRSTLHIHTGDR